MLIKRKLSSIIILSIIICNLVLPIHTFFAEIPLPFRISIEDQRKVITPNSVKLEWDLFNNADYYNINYYTNDYGTSVLNTEETNEISHVIEGLQPGIIYDFDLDAYDSLDNELIGENENFNLYVLTSIKNFRAYRIDEEIEENQLEIGSKPGLHLSWEKPLVRNGDTFKNIPENCIDYEINVRKSKYSVQDAVERFKVIYHEDDNKYHLYRWDGNTFIQANNEFDLPNTPSYNLQSDTDVISFEWKKEADEANNVDKDSAIKPGSVYYIEIYPRFKTGTQYEEVHYVKTELKSEFISTYLRVKLARHNDNVIFSGYRVVNDGTFTELPSFLYEFWVGTDINNLTRQYYEYEDDAGEYAQEYIDAFITNAAMFENYYKLTATASEIMNNNEPIELSSQAISANLSKIETVASPIPRNLEVLDVKLNEEDVPEITIRWDKPEDYSNMIASDDYEYNIHMNSTVNNMYDDNGNLMTEELEDDEGNIRNFELKYREAFSIEVKEDNPALPLRERLRIIDKNEVGSDELNTGEDRIELTFEGKDLFINDPEGYPTVLKLNKIYYIKMSVSKAGEIKTDYTVPIAIVTPDKSKIKPYLPNNIEIEEITHNNIELHWQPVELGDYKYFNVDEEPDINYEVSISTDPNRELLEGVKYGGFINPLYTISTDEAVGVTEVIDFKMVALTDNFYGVNIKGIDLNDSTKTLTENTQYYILIRTKLTVSDESIEPKYSDYSRLFSATTLKQDINEPGEDEKYPGAPEDFSVAQDFNGNPIIQGTSVILHWSLDELFDDVKYRVIRSQKPVTDVENWDNQFNTLPDDLNAFEFPLDYINNAYRTDSKDFLLECGELIPNKLYFFNIQAYREVDSEGDTKILTSEWITIPVTTTLIESPKALKIVDVTDNDEDYSYFNKYYNIKIAWESIELAEESGGQRSFDIAIKKSQDENYEIINTIDSDIIRFKHELIETGKERYSAIITGLESNTKYNIKIRVVDPNNFPISKYTPVVSGRTAFSSEDYDDKFKEDYKESIFDSKISKYRKSWYWAYNFDESVKELEYSIKLVGDKVINQTNYNNRCVINMEDIKPNETNKESKLEIYIPYDLIKYLYDYKTNMVLKTSYGKFIFYYKVFDPKKNKAIKEMLEKKEDRSSVNDIFIRLNMENTKDIDSYNQSNQIISDIISLNAQVEAVKDTEEDVQDKIEKYIFGSDETGNNDGLIYQKRNTLDEVSDDYSEMIEDIDNIIKEIDEDIMDFVDNIVNSSSFVKYSEDMEEVPYGVGLSLNYKNPGNKNISIYITDDNDEDWQKVYSEVNNYRHVCESKIQIFDGYFTAVLSKTSQIYDLSSSKYINEIEYMQNNYGISEVFSSYGYIYPKKEINCEQVLQVFNKIAGRQDENVLLSSDKIAKKYELDKLNIYNDSITKQEAAYIALRLYELFNGVNVDNLTVNKYVTILDKDSISEVYLKSVLLSLDLGIIELDSNMFNPDKNVSRGEFLSIIKKTIDLCE